LALAGIKRDGIKTENMKITRLMREYNIEKRVSLYKVTAELNKSISKEGTTVYIDTMTKILLSK